MEVLEIRPAVLQGLLVRRSLLKARDDAEQQQLNQSLSPDLQSDNLPGASSADLSWLCFSLSCSSYWA